MRVSRHRRRKTAALAAAVAAVAGAVAGCGSAGHHASPLLGPLGYWTRNRLLHARPWGEGPAVSPSATPTARTRRATLQQSRVGALFAEGATGNHFCTASVVDSAGHNLLITAAHCVSGGKNGGYAKNIVFIPGYRDGAAPFGVWTPSRLLVAPQWQKSSDPGYDVGFVTLNSNHGKNIQDILGANRLRFNPGYRESVRVTGYPDNGNAPVVCRNWTTEQSPTQLRFNCAGFYDGTSGSPFVTHFSPLSRTGTIIGVIGGYQQGGDTPSVSYSSYFGSGIESLYSEADRRPAS
ncbi:MAG: trypsin-like serine protease [Streptosporangiales bacterium]|nr:trypsin-like serine protease [Streptosporangiales bacterium]